MIRYTSVESVERLFPLEGIYWLILGQNTQVGLFLGVKDVIVLSIIGSLY